MESCPVQGTSTRFVLLSLAERANRDGVCWPGIGDIARRAKLSPRQVQRLLRRLATAGEIRIVPGGKGAGDSSGYVVVAGRDLATVDALAERTRQFLTTRRKRAGTGLLANEPTPAKGDTADTLRVTSATDKGDTHDTLRVTPATPKPSGNRKRTVRQNREADAREGAVAAAEPRPDTDPDAAAFEGLLLEKRADAHRRQGGMTSGPLAGAAGEKLGARGAKARKGRRRRIPQAEQERTLAMLRAVPGLDPADARDLARIAPHADFERAVNAMTGNIRNPGGWLRRAVTEGWGEATAGP